MNEFTRKAMELADAWVVEAIHEALAANTGKISSADGEAARAALLAHLEGGEQKPIARVEKHTGSLRDMAIIIWLGEQPLEGTLLYAFPADADAREINDLAEVMPSLPAATPTEESP